MNRRGFLAGLVSTGLLPSIPFKPEYVGDFNVASSGNGWAVMHPSVYDPDAPLTSSLAKSMNATTKMETTHDT